MAKRKERRQPPRGSEASRSDDEPFRLLVEGVKDYALFMLDAAGRIASWNPGAEHLKGYKSEEAIGQHVAIFYPAEDRQARKPERELEFAAANGKYEEENWRLRKDGSRFWASVLITALFDEAGAVRGFAKVTRDLTERKKADDELRRARDELEVRVRERTTELTAANQALQRSNEHLATQYACARVMAEAETVAEATPRLLEAVCRDLRWDWSSVWAIDTQRQVLRCVETWHDPSVHFPRFEEVSRDRSMACGAGLPGRVWASGKPAWVKDVQQDPNFPRLAVAKEEGLRAALGFPISVEGEFLGVMEFVSREVREPDDDMLQMLAALGSQLGQFIYRKRAEEALRDNEARKSGMLEAALDCVISIDHQGKVVEWNPAAETTFGYPRAEALGREMAELIIPAEYRDRHRRGLAHFLKTGEGPVLGRRLEMPALRADGSVFPSELALVPIRCSGGPLFTGYLRDITDRKRAEEELRPQREWLAVTLRSIGDAVIATDTRGLVIFMNPVAEVLTGWSQAKAVGKPLEAIFNIVNEESRARVESPVTKVLREGTLQGLANHTRLIAKNGVERPIDDCASPIHDANKVRGVVLIFHDITERRALEKRLEERAGQLLEADRRKDEFLAMLAHELRNPLAPIRNALHVLRHKGGDWKTVEQVRAMMTRQVEHLARLVDDLLDVSRITRGKVSLRKERLDLARLVRECAHDHQHAFATAGVTLTCEVPETPVWVTGDATRLTQVLDNLLANAMKFTTREGKAAVKLAPDVAHQQALLTVSDSGIGIEAEMLPRVFTVFSQADRTLARSPGGLGLGLAIVKGLVELHGGCIQAASEGVGRGAAFSIRLPLEEELPALSEAPVSSPPTEKRLRVLVVEDNRDSADSLRMLLELFGYEVRVAYSGPEGVEAATEVRPDVVLCDIGLPGMDGYAVAQALRKNPDTAGTCLIAVTGYGQEEDKQRAFEAGFNDHLVKPVNPDKLLEQLAPSRKYKREGKTSEEG